MDKTADRLAIPKRLASVEPGTRLRLFHMEMGKTAATSGRLLHVTRGEIHVARDDGAEVKVLLATVTRFYVPPDVRPTTADFEGFVARARRAIAGLRRPTPPQRLPEIASGDALGQPGDIVWPAAHRDDLAAAVPLERRFVDEIELPPAPSRRPGQLASALDHSASAVI